MQKERRLPYRDEEGTVNIHLLQRSINEIASGAACDAHMHAKAVAWLKHGHSTLLKSSRAVSGSTKDSKLQRDDADDDDDEHLTLDELLRAELSSGCTATRPQVLPETVTQLDRRVSRKRLRAFSGQALFASAEPDGTEQRESASEQSASERSDETDEEAAQSQQSMSDAETGPLGVLDSAAESGDDVYEVKQVLGESQGHLRLRWAGFGPEHDSWEPEANVSRALLRGFRAAKRARREHEGRDYGGAAGHRPTQLWCTACRAHVHIDSFSAKERRAESGERTCLEHAVARARANWRQF